MRYLKSWFAVDFIAAFPFGWFLTGLPLDTTHGVKAFKLLKLARLMKLAKMVPLIRKWRNVLHINPSVFRMLLFFFLIFLAAHWMACGWIALNPEPLGDDFQRTYLQALYWVITTMTTVGYGDITPSTNAQIVYAMFVMIGGVGTYGYVIANLANFLRNIDTAKMDFLRNGRGQCILAYRDIPPAWSNAFAPTTITSGTTDWTTTKTKSSTTSPHR